MRPEGAYWLVVGDTKQCSRYRAEAAAGFRRYQNAQQLVYLLYTLAIAAQQRGEVRLALEHVRDGLTWCQALELRRPLSGLCRLRPG